MWIFIFFFSKNLLSFMIFFHAASKLLAMLLNCGLRQFNNRLGVNYRVLKAQASLAVASENCLSQVQMLP